MLYALQGKRLHFFYDEYHFILKIPQTQGSAEAAMIDVFIFKILYRKQATHA